MKIKGKKQLIKIIRADIEKFLKSKDGKNYIQLMKQEENKDNLVFVKGVN